MSTKAELFLYKSILKSKPIVSSPAFPSYILANVEKTTQPQDIAQANVQARLFNSNIVKAAMKNIMDGTRTALGIENEDSAGKKKRLRASDYIPENKSITLASLNKLGPGEILATKEEDKAGSQTKSESLHGKPCVNRSDNDSVNSAAYADRLAESENESSEESCLQKSSRERKTLEHNSFRDLSPSPSRTLSSSSSVSDNPKIRKVPIKTPKSTIFLPSLTTGGYISDSDSAVSDPYSLPGNASTKPPRKNRRGQQERRQIWEKKYGQNANHLKRQGQQQQQQTRDQGWDARKGAAQVGGSDDRGKRGRGRGRSKGPGRVIDASTGFSSTRTTARARATGKVGPTSSGANSDPIQARRGGGNKLHDGQAKRNQPPTAAAAAASTPLHPSWEAAKKQKEAKKNVAFLGKKVVFT